MSALTHAGQPAPASGRSRERGGARLADLAWLTWRQHRTVIIAGLVIAAAVTGSMLYVAARITAISQECGNAACPDGSAQAALLGRLDDARFVAGFGSNGGEEFLSYMNISEGLVVKGGLDWKRWDDAMTGNLGRIQNSDPGGHRALPCGKPR